MTEKKKIFDKLDYRVMKELAKDARASSAKIASKIGANERTVNRRIHKLLKTKAVRIVTIVEPSMFDYHSIADINLKVDDCVYDDFVDSCKQNPNVCYIASGWGEANLAIETRFLDNDQMYQFINETLENTRGVRVVNFFIIPKIIYNIDSWFPVRSDFK